MPAFEEHAMAIFEFSMLHLVKYHACELIRRCMGKLWTAVSVPRPPPADFVECHGKTVSSIVTVMTHFSLHHLGSVGTVWAFCVA